MAKPTSDEPKGGGTGPIPGARTDPSAVPRPRTAAATAGTPPTSRASAESKRGNGAQRRQGERKS